MYHLKPYMVYTNIVMSLVYGMLTFAIPKFSIPHTSVGLCVTMHPLDMCIDSQYTLGINT